MCSISIAVQQRGKAMWSSTEFDTGSYSRCLLAFFFAASFEEMFLAKLLVMSTVIGETRRIVATIGPALWTDSCATLKEPLKREMNDPEVIECRVFRFVRIVNQ
jgi:hypothetical protein